MTDISEFATACANRIFDRMEQCRGSAILKEDIVREVEMTLRGLIADLLKPGKLEWVAPEEQLAPIFVDLFDPKSYFYSRGTVGNITPGEIDASIIKELDLGPGTIHTDLGNGPVSLKGCNFAAESDGNPLGPRRSLINCAGMKIFVDPSLRAGEGYIVAPDGEIVACFKD